jgi:hypothetical protein
MKSFLYMSLQVTDTTGVCLRSVVPETCETYYDIELQNPSYIFALNMTALKVKRIHCYH